MITVYSRENDKLTKSDLNALRSKKLTWVDCNNPSSEELNQIAGLTMVGLKDLQERLVGYERPTAIEDEQYSLIIFGAPVIKSHTAKATSLSIFITGSNIITIRTEEIEAIEKFKELMIGKSSKYMNSVTRFVQVLLEKITDNYFDHLELFREEADKIESKVIQAPHESDLERTFRLRKSLLFFHKALVANKEAISVIEKQHLSRLSKKELEEFKDVREDVLQLIDAEDTLRNILTGILDIYTSSVSNQMNRVIKKLTVVASYVLIPTLIASIYGMNFRNMPELFWQWGYPFSICLMIFSILLVYFYFRKSKMI